jgi:glyoxylase-like metal-dependent hydrolase (beta-lactamase superfamily II)
VTISSRDLGGGAWQLQTPLWETNALLVCSEGDAIVVDPCFRPAEVETIRAEVAARAAGAVHVAITHGDFDHVCGIGFFPDAVAVGSAATSRRIESEIVEGLEQAQRDWGEPWPAGIRIDRVVAPGDTVALGAVRVETIDAANHGVDGLAYAFPDHGILAAGDFLSALAGPALLGSLDGMRRSCERLLQYIAQHELHWVVPGHGPALAPADARRAGEADLDYLDRLNRAARDAADEGLSRMEIAMHVFAVEPPRPSTPEFGIYAERVTTAWAAVEGVLGAAS